MKENKSLQELQREIESAQERIAALTVLQEVAQNLTSELNLQKLLKKILRSAVEVMKASAGSLLIWDVASNELIFAMIEGGGGKALEGRRMPAYKGIAGWVFSQRQPSIVHDVRNDERFFSAIDESLGYQTSSLIAAPLLAKGKAIGVIEILNKRSGKLFNENDQDILCALASQAAVAIVNARLYQEVREERDKMIALEEELRKGLARDFHDGPAQTLSAIIMDLDFVKRLLREDPEHAIQEMDKLRKVVVKAMQQVRNMIFELRPLVLETQGLKVALHSYAQRLHQTEGLDVHLSIGELTEKLPVKVEEVCFTIVQEAINNIKKHAVARNVWLTIGLQKGELTVTVKDDGQGFDMKRVERFYSEEGHLGLLSMQERAEAIGGQLSIKSSPGRGTSVVLTVPLYDQEPPPSSPLATTYLRPPPEM